MENLVEMLNSPLRVDRLDALRQLKAALDRGEIAKPELSRDVNNHIHTHYSFSPYSPTKAVWMAYQAGLVTAGLMDHDSISGAREFIAAGNIMNFPTTIGCEIRVSFADTELEGRRINNPDQNTVAYIALHGIPHSEIQAVDKFLEPIRKARGLRNRKMINLLNQHLADSGLALDYDRDILPLSARAEGGEVTERHLLFGLALLLLKHFPHPAELLGFIHSQLGLSIGDKLSAQLTDLANPHRAYDLLGLLKSELVEQFYVAADDAECPRVSEVVAFAKTHGIILAYPYLGDVGDSVTGDKKTQKFEDDYLPVLFDLLANLGFTAVTYMPSRNTREQLIRLRSLCEKHQFYQISGEDINQPRQSFVCQAMRDPLFENLYDAAWALIGHERLATASLSGGLFSQESLAEQPDLQARIEKYRDFARSLYA
ncbi:MAG: PHP domain-containing protein [Eubacteriales bacterium]|nr:PHP domain-containing protein [Eubacteriales bacterium]